MILSTKSPGFLTPVVPDEASRPYAFTDNVAAIWEDGRVLLQSGKIARRTGSGALKTGEPVTVLWSSVYGNTVIEHKVRRDDKTPPAPVFGGGVEELFLFRDGPASDVFYRNAQQVTRLNLGAFLPATSAIHDIGWSADGEAFFVVGVENVADPQPGGTTTGVPFYEIFKLSPSQKTRPRGAMKVSARRVKTVRTIPTGLPFFSDAWENGVRTIHSQRFFYGVEQPVLSETLEIYGVFAMSVGVAGFGGGPPPKVFEATGFLNLIMQPAGTIVYTDPIVAVYMGQKDSVIDTNQQLFLAHSIRLLSWSDRTLSTRRWFSVYSKFWNDIVDDVDVLLESSFSSDVYAAGALKLAVASGVEWATPNRDRRVTYAPFIVPTMSTGRYIVVDQPTAWAPVVSTLPVISRRDIIMLDLKTSARTTIFQWVKATDDTRFGYAPKLHQMEMLASGVLYAFPEAQVTLGTVFDDLISVPPGGYYDVDNAPPPPLPEEGTSQNEREKFVDFTAPNGAVNATFLTDAQGLKEDGKLRGKGKVSKKLPPGFALVLANADLLAPTADQTVVVRRWMRPV